MKRQDRREVPHEDLLDDFELGNREYGEIPEFGGKIRHGDLRHALRVFNDQSSDVVRLEASALRGPMAGVPLWTAFVTKYVNDPDWAHFEGDGVVSLAALRPKPYVFLSGYEPPKNGKNEYILQFTSRSGQYRAKGNAIGMLTELQMLSSLLRLGMACVGRDDCTALR